MLVALLSLTLGIGATSAIFSVIYGVLIAPYPYARPGEIWAPEARALDGRGGHGYTLDELRALTEVPAFADVMATSMETVLMTGEFAPESFGGVLLSGNAFNFLGVPPVVGRTIQPTDIRPDGQAEPVVVLSHRLWLRLFEGSPSAIGRTLRLNGRPHTIVGVMPPRFGWYGNDGFWLPLSPTRTDLPGISPIVRLAPGVSSTVGEEQLGALHQRLAQEKPATFPKQGFTTRLRNYLDVTVASGEMRTSLQLLLGAVAFLLLIACANVANLQLARGTARAREMAVRMSIGAGRRRLLRQLLTESVLLSLAGGVLGVLFAFGAIRTIVALMPEFYVPNESRVAINFPVLLFSLAVSMLTGIVFGLVPALHSSRSDITDELKAGRSTGAGTQGGRTRNLLVVIEVALSVVLLVSAGLTVRTFFVLQNMDAGHSGRSRAAGGRAAAADQVRDARGAQPLRPGAAGAGWRTPRRRGGHDRPSVRRPAIAVHDRRTDPDESKRLTVNLVGADHLRTFGIPLRAGRMFDASEAARGDRVALVNEAAAKLWPAGENPIGARLRLGVLERPPRGSWPIRRAARGHDHRRHRRHSECRPPGGAAARDHPAVFDLAASSACWRSERAGDPNLLLNPVRAAVRRMDPEQPLGRPITLARSSVRKSCSRASRWRCSVPSRRSDSRSRPPASTACCRSTSRDGRTSSACAWRSARRAATCSA